MRYGYFLALLGVIIAGLGFWFQFLRKPKEELVNLEVQFLSTRELSIKLQSQLEEIAEKFDCWEEDIFTGMSYKSYIKTLEKTRGENLSMELLNKVTKQRLPKETIHSMFRSLENQFNELLQISNIAKIKLEQDSPM